MAAQAAKGCGPTQGLPSIVSAPGDQPDSLAVPVDKDVPGEESKPGALEIMICWTKQQCWPPLWSRVIVSQSDTANQSKKTSLFMY